MKTLLLAALGALALAACGSSSKDDPADPQPAPSAPPEPITYVALGDSAGFGIGALPGEGGYPPRLARRLEEAGRDVELVNLSVPGATARDLARADLPAALLPRADLFTLCIGGNDVSEGRSGAEFAQDLETVLARLEPLDADVVLCNVPDVSLTPRYAGDPAVRARVDELNAALAEVAARRGLPVVDLAAVSRDRLYDEPELLSDDGFHPSPEGYEVWAEAMLPVVEAALAAP